MTLTMIMSAFIFYKMEGMTAYDFKVLKERWLYGLTVISDTDMLRAITTEEQATMISWYSSLPNLHYPEMELQWRSLLGTNTQSYSSSLVNFNEYRDNILSMMINMCLIVIAIVNIIENSLNLHYGPVELKHESTFATNNNKEQSTLVGEENVKESFRTLILSASPNIPLYGWVYLLETMFLFCYMSEYTSWTTTITSFIVATAIGVCYWRFMFESKWIQLASAGMKMTGTIKDGIICTQSKYSRALLTTCANSKYTYITMLIVLRLARIILVG